MLYYLFDWFKQQNIHFPGSGLFEFITFRVLLAMLLSLVIATLFGRRLINYLRRKQVGESVRDLGLAGEQSKKGTPTMGESSLFFPSSFRLYYWQIFIKYISG